HLGLSFVEQAGNARFSIQNDDYLASNWSLYDKWVKVKTQFAAAAGQRLGGVFQVNSLHGGGGVSASFAASGNITSGHGSPNLATGFMSRYGNNGWEDFPRAGCFFGGSICSIMFEGINPLTLSFIETAGPNHVGIVRADYPGRALINAIIDVNRSTVPPVQLTWGDSGRCLDIKGGSQIGSTELASNACDLASTSQRWYAGSDGMIRPVFEPQRCVVANAGHSVGSRLRLGDCDPVNHPTFFDRGQGLFAVDDAAWLCMEAGGASLAPNTPIQLGTCSYAAARQRFAAVRLPSPLVAGNTTCLQLFPEETTPSARPCVYGQDRQQWLLKEDATLRSALPPYACVTFRPDDATRPVVMEPCATGSGQQRWEGRPDGTLRPRTRRDACLTLAENGRTSVAACVPGSVMQRFAFSRMPVQLRWNTALCLARSKDPGDASIIANTCDIADKDWRFMADQTVRLGKYRSNEPPVAPDRCISIAGDVAKVGASIVEALCVPDKPTQRWNWMPDRSLRPDSQPGLCVEAPDALTGNNHRLKLAACRTAYAAQRWTAR
ncbi:MAG: plcA, partial [Rhizobacter sp.]|nr:plcA [Rhizobacter sp.]